jgi:hypothetical protein
VFAEPARRDGGTTAAFNLATVFPFLVELPSLIVVPQGNVFLAECAVPRVVLLVGIDLVAFESAFCAERLRFALVTHVFRRFRSKA